MSRISRERDFIRWVKWKRSPEPRLQIYGAVRPEDILDEIQGRDLEIGLKKGTIETIDKGWAIVQDLMKDGGYATMTGHHLEDQTKLVIPPEYRNRLHDEHLINVTAGRLRVDGHDLLGNPNLVPGNEVVLLDQGLEEWLYVDKRSRNPGIKLHVGDWWKMHKSLQGVFRKLFAEAGIKEIVVRGAAVNSILTDIAIREGLGFELIQSSY